MLQQLEIFFEHSTFSLAMCIWSSQIIDQNPLTYPLDKPLVVFHSETEIQNVSVFFLSGTYISWIASQSKLRPVLLRATSHNHVLVICQIMAISG